MKLAKIAMSLRYQQFRLKKVTIALTEQTARRNAARLPAGAEITVVEEFVARPREAQRVVVKKPWPM